MEEPEIENRGDTGTITARDDASPVMLITVIIAAVVLFAALLAAGFALMFGR